MQNWFEISVSEVCQEETKCKWNKCLIDVRHIIFLAKKVERRLSDFLITNILKLMAKMFQFNEYAQP